MNEKNLESIKMQLVSLGVPAKIEYDLRLNACFQPEHFQIQYWQKNEGDTMNTIFIFDRNENEYVCRYYEACLRKEIAVPSAVLNEVDIDELQKRMCKIDWNVLFTKNLLDHGNVEKDGSRDIERSIELIVSDLKKLATTQEGSQVADCLKWRFWADSPLVSFITNINFLKNQYEISQRFYFFDDGGQITIDEAYRFLSHRWREKQLNAKKKQSESTDKSPKGSNAAGTLNANKLLQKRRINKGKQFKQ